MSNFSYKATVNETLELDEVNAKDLDFVRTGDNSYHVIYQNQSFNAMILETDHQNKTFRIEVNGSIYNISLADHYDQLVNKLGFKVNTDETLNDIKAPMPGLVLEIDVKVGQSVVKGDALLILEAMKMENVIKAPGDAVIKKIVAKQGEAVEKNQILIELE